MTALAAETSELERAWVELDHSARRITVGGEFDIATYPTLVDLVLAFHRVTGGDLALDLDAVTFIDAGTFSALVLISNILRTRRSRLRIIGNARCLRVAGLCQLDSLLASY
jgi:anti-anti-sigma factor